jgi:RNA polymerase sigma factor (sigma-70 family)
MPRGPKSTQHDIGQDDDLDLAALAGAELDTAELPDDAELVDDVDLTDAPMHVRQANRRDSSRLRGAALEEALAAETGSYRHRDLIETLGELAAGEVLRWEVSRGGWRGVHSGEQVASLAAFSRRMEQYPQLSTAAQNELAARYQESLRHRTERDEAEQVLRSEKRTRVRAKLISSIDELDKSVTRGERCVEYLLGSNFRLVLLIAREVTESRYGREAAAKLMADVIAEATAALYEAARIYDPVRCSAFHTYASRLIRERVRMTLGREGTIRLVPSWGRVKRIAAVRIPELTSQLGRAPTMPELQADLLRVCEEWADKHLTDVERALPEQERHAARMGRLRKQGMLGAINAIEEVLTVSGPVASLDAPVSADGETTLGGLISAPGEDAAVERVQHEQLVAVLSQAMAEVLNERERLVLAARMGMGGRDETNFRELGEQLGVSAERVRQIEKAALTKLAATDSPFAHKLRSFLPSLAHD